MGFKFLLTAVYIPPENSQYSDIDLFDKLEEEITNFTSPINDNNVPFVLCGELNAWCGEKSEFIINDIDDPNYNFNNEIIENFNIFNHLKSLEFTRNQFDMYSFVSQS